MRPRRRKRSVSTQLRHKTTHESLAIESVTKSSTNQSPDPPAPEDCLTCSVRQTWQFSGYAALRLISCECDGGVVVIRGTVPSFHLKQLAQERIRSLPGVQQIVNKLDVCDIGEERSIRDQDRHDISTE